MVGTKGKSGGIRPGAGRPTLTQQFFEAVKATQQSITEEDENTNLKSAISLQKRIERRLLKLRAEVEELEKAERSYEWSAVKREAK